MDELDDMYAPPSGGGAERRFERVPAFGILLRETLGIASTAALVACFPLALAAYFAPTLTDACLRFALAVLFFAVSALLVRATLLIRDALAEPE